MNFLKQLNDAVRYVEEHLTEEIDPVKVSAIAAVSTDTFLRFFSYMTGMSLSEYIRKRRLTVAAVKLEHTPIALVDLAVLYGYSGAAAFSRAFSRQHGISPSEFRREGGSLNILLPLTFQITIQGAAEMRVDKVHYPGASIRGLSRLMEEHETREEIRHRMWSETEENIPCLITDGRWNEPDSYAMDGEWYGIWQNGRYLIGRTPDLCTHVENLEEVQIPEGTYAVFRTEPGGAAWEEIPKLFHQILDIWLPSSGEVQGDGLIVEVYHLWTDCELRRKKRYYEVWIPLRDQE